MKTSIENLVHEAYRLDREVKEKTARLRDLKKQIEAAAAFPAGKNTGQLSTPHYSVKVTRKFNETWDQTILNSTVRGTLGDGIFLKLFRFKFEPEAKQLSGYLEHGPEEHKALIEDARTIRDGAPQITFETLENY